MKKVTNDQINIINGIVNKQYDKVWHLVKYIGYKDMPEMQKRYIFFYSIVDDFDYEKNNNFILFYKQRLKYIKIDENKTFYITSNRTIIGKLINESISPEGELLNSPMTREYSHWNN